MKKYLLILACFLLDICYGADKTQKSGQPLQAPAKAEKKYEMKQYYFVMLVRKKDREEITDTNELNRIQAGHMANIGTPGRRPGRSVVAGPIWR